MRRHFPLFIFAWILGCGKDAPPAAEKMLQPPTPPVPTDSLPLSPATSQTVDTLASAEQQPDTPTSPADHPEEVASIDEAALAQVKVPAWVPCWSNSKTVTCFVDFPRVVFSSEDDIISLKPTRDGRLVFLAGDALWLRDPRQGKTFELTKLKDVRVIMEGEEQTAQSASSLFVTNTGVSLSEDGPHGFQMWSQDVPRPTHIAPWSAMSSAGAVAGVSAPSGKYRFELRPSTYISDEGHMIDTHELGLIRGREEPRFDIFDIHAHCRAAGVCGEGGCCPCDILSASWFPNDILVASVVASCEGGGGEINTQTFLWHAGARKMQQIQSISVSPDGRVLANVGWVEADGGWHGWPVGLGTELFWLPGDALRRVALASQAVTLKATVPIERGAFVMGSPSTEPKRQRDELEHKVVLTRNFEIGAHEVSVAEWAEVMGSVPSGLEQCGPDCPVESVSWFDVLVFLNTLSKRQNLEPCYELTGCSGTPGGGCGTADLKRGFCTGDFTCSGVFERPECRGYRLPTEAEWEFAARAGTSTATHVGTFPPLGRNNAPQLDPIARYGGNSGVSFSGAFDCSRWNERQVESARCGPGKLGEKQPNAWKLHDTLGNLSEWVWDAYGPYPKSDSTDPRGPASGSERVHRGGGYASNAADVRVARRFKLNPRRRDLDVGFRLARTLDPKTP